MQKTHVMGLDLDQTYIKHNLQFWSNLLGPEEIHKNIKAQTSIRLRVPNIVSYNFRMVKD